MGRTQAVRRRSELMLAIEHRYGVRSYEHPREPSTIVMSRSWFNALTDDVMHDPTLDALGRGYYLGMGGELTFLIAPDWACDGDAIVQARLVGMHRQTFRPLLSALTASRAWRAVTASERSHARRHGPSRPTR